MRWPARFRRSLRITRYRPDPRRDVTDEIEFHLEMRTRELIDSGMDPDLAGREALEAFGERESIEKECMQLTK